MEAANNDIYERFPLHWLVWNDEHTKLDEELQKIDVDRERRDPRGRTPLLLAVTLGHTAAARVLLRHNCNVNADNAAGWNVSQEAIATGDPELAQMVLRERDVQRYSSRATALPALLQRLTEAPDFYVEMKWEFASWVPLVSRMCPHDTYKVYKRGSRVRIDTTLLGFDDTSWQRGNKSYIFKGQSDRVVVTEVDHEERVVFSEEVQLASGEVLAGALGPDDAAIEHRLTTPIVTTYIDTAKINFERNKSGIWGWRSDRTEEVSGRDSKVFSASNVELITKTRTEHLSEQDREQTRSFVKNPLHSILGVAEVEEARRTPSPEASTTEVSQQSTNPCHITVEEYFDPTCDLGDRDIGRPRCSSVKTQKLKATLWLCEEYPLSLQEQVMPIVDLMSIQSTHFAKLKEFIQMQLPAGFPVKIEIPLFHVLTARITFGNIFAADEPVPHVSVLQEEDRVSCLVDDAVFEPPAGYRSVGSGVLRHYGGPDEEDELLQMAIQQSLLDSGTENEQVDIWEALRAESATPRGGQPAPDLDEQMLQRAIQLSLCPEGGGLGGGGGGGVPLAEPPASPDDPALSAALELSRREDAAADQRRLQEEEEMRRAIELSLLEQ